MKCKICKCATTKLTKCQICGKRVCNFCLRIITRPFQPVYSFSTIPIGNLSSPRIPIPSKKINCEDIYICKNCADLLSLSLRIAKAKYAK